MALDPGIILSGRSADVASGLSSGIQMGGMLQQLQAAKAQEPIRNQLLQQQAQRGEMALQQAQAQSAEAEQNRRLGSIANTYSGIQVLVDSGKFNEAADTLEANKEVLRRSGITNFEDSDFAIEALRSGDAQAIRNVQLLGEQAVQIATERGILGDDDKGISAEGRSFERLISGLSPEDQEKAVRIKLRLDAPAGTSAEERIAQSEELTNLVAKSKSTIEGQRAESKEIGKAKGEAKGAPLIAGAKATISRAVKLAEADAKSRGEALSDLKKAEAGLPGIEEVVGKLNSLSSIATHTISGKVLNAASKELGFGATKGGTARAAYQATIDNQVLPLLKQTFGAAMTEGEGKRLADTLGDVDASPEEKQAQLNAFMDSQRRIIENLRRETGQTGVQDTGISVDEFRAMTPEQRAATIQRLQGR